MDSRDTVGDLGDLDLPTASEIMTMLLAESREVNRAAKDLVQWAKKAAPAERDYRKAKAKAALQAEQRLTKAIAEVEATFGLDTGGAFEDRKPTVDEKKAYVDLVVSPEMLDAHVARNMKAAMKGILEARQAVLSAIQSVSRAYLSELEMARKGV